MAQPNIAGAGTREQPWQLKTPSGQSEIMAYRDEGADPPALVLLVGKTEVRGLTDVHAMLQAHGDWMALGSVDEQKSAAAGTGASRTTCRR